MGMFRIARTVLADSAGLARVCGLGVSLKWLICILKCSRQCIARGDLQPADAAMGEGPFHVRLGAARARLSGPQVISGIREIWVRDAYLGNGFLSIPPDACVVDLGANNGNFTMLALGHGPGVSVVAVEANREFNGRLTRMAAENGWADRVQVVNAFVGGETSMQSDCRSASGYQETPWITERDLITQSQLVRIDFLKCDIEGSEFELLKPGSELLRLTDQIALELHDFAGSRTAFMEMLRSEGFEVHLYHSTPSDCLVMGRRRHPVPSDKNPPSAVGMRSKR